MTKPFFASLRDVAAIAAVRMLPRLSAATRDLVALAGGAAIVRGAWIVNEALGWIVLGVILLAAAWAWSVATARSTT